MFNTEMEARKYLETTDFYFLSDKVQQLTLEKKTEIETNRENARNILRSLTNK
tara:strand:- start:43 stop:201 length:159 start_codon:yes stop_codon:yes gene_type:complete